MMLSYVVDGGDQEASDRVRGIGCPVLFSLLKEPFLLSPGALYLLWSARLAGLALPTLLTSLCSHPLPLFACPWVLLILATS